MTATISPTVTPAPSASGIRSAIASKPLWLVGVGATIVAAVVTAVVAAIAGAADVPLEVASSANDAPEAIPAGGFATMVLAFGAIGVVLALALNRWAKRPARTFLVVTGVLTAASFISPTEAVAHNATTATRMVLVLTHLVAAAIIIPPIATRLARR